MNQKIENKNDAKQELIDRFDAIEGIANRCICYLQEKEMHSEDVAAVDELLTRIVEIATQTQSNEVRQARHLLFKEVWDFLSDE